MQHNDLNKKIINTLESKAKHHAKRHLVINNVFAKVEQQRHQKFNRWGFTGFALAAAITGFVILPNNVLNESNDTQSVTVNASKLTPQLADDLEMLLVLGEDATHGS